MAWPGHDMYNAPQVVFSDRPARGRLRQASDHPRQTMYFTDAYGNLLPHAGMGTGRSYSMSGGRPAQIVINNRQYDEFSPGRRRSHTRSPSYDDDDSWDERAHSPDRHRDRSRNRSRRGSRDRSRHRSRSHSRRRHSRSPSHSHHHDHGPQSPPPVWDPEMERKMKRIEELDRKEKEEAALEHARQAMLIEKAEEAAKKKEEAEFKKRVLAEAEREKFEEELRKKKKKEEEDKFFHARLKEMYLAQGYSEESIEIMIKDAEEKKKKGHGNEIVKITEQTKVVDLSKSTWIKVNRKYMSPETLDAHGLPWEWDDRDNTYIIIKRWINENDLDKLFEHTRKLRERRLAIPNEANMVGLIKENGKLKLVREKSPNRRRRSFVLS